MLCRPSALPTHLSNTRMAPEVLQVGHLGQQRIGQVVVDRGARGVAGIARAEMPAGFDRNPPAAEGQMDVGVVGEEPRAQPHQSRFGVATWR